MGQILRGLDLHVNCRANASTGRGCGSRKVHCTTSVITVLGKIPFVSHKLYPLSEESVS